MVSLRSDSFARSGVAPTKNIEMNTRAQRFQENRGSMNTIPVRKGFVMRGKVVVDGMATQASRRSSRGGGRVLDPDYDGMRVAVGAQFLSRRSGRSHRD